MAETLKLIFSHAFIIRALAAGALISLCAALLGVSLVLKRYSMIGDGLAHVAFGALSLALVTGAAPLAVSIPVVIAAAFGLLRLSENSRIKGDAAIALISSLALAAGIIAASLKKGMNIDVYSYMFGSILAVSPADVRLSALLAAAVLTLFILFYHKIFSVTFDEDFASAAGMGVRAYNSLLALLTAVTIVIGMRIMGTLLISSLIVFPAVSAMRVCRSFRSAAVTAAVISLVCFFCGVLVSFILSIPTGASIVVINAAAFAAAFVVGKFV